MPFCEQKLEPNMPEKQFDLVHPRSVRPRTSGDVAVVPAEPVGVQTVARDDTGMMAPPPDGEVVCFSVKLKDATSLDRAGRPKKSPKGSWLRWFQVHRCER